MIRLFRRTLAFLLLALVTAGSASAFEVITIPEDVSAVNLTGVVLGTRAALPHLKKTKGNKGKVVV